MEFEDPEIIDINGQAYRAGWDQYGWFTFQAGEMRQFEEDDEPKFYPDKDISLFSLPPDKIDKVIEMMEEGR